MQKDINENNFLNLLNNIFENKNEYFSKKNNLIRLTKEDTWEKNKIKLTKLINENLFRKKRTYSLCRYWRYRYEWFSINYEWFRL